MRLEWTQKTLALNIKNWRAEMGLSQSQLALATGVSYRLIQELEAGKGNPTVETLFKLAAVFKVTMNQLLELRFIKLSESQEDFLQIFKKNFKAATVSAFLRNLEGVILWGNKNAERYLRNTSLSHGPVDLSDEFFSDLKTMLSLQYSSERLGNSFPYMIYMDQPRSKERIYYKCYPTLILPFRGRQPIFSSVYITEISQDCVGNYFTYCQHLFHCIFD